jgi:lipoyl(octanoyl) transferase
VEHPHVYTLGKSGDLSNLLYLKSWKPKELLSTKSIVVVTSPITDPGQIVGYPILDLENFFTDIHKYLRFLEEAIIPR